MLTPKQQGRKAQRIARLERKGRSSEGIEGEYRRVEEKNAVKTVRRKARKQRVA